MSKLAIYCDHPCSYLLKVWVYGALSNLYRVTLIDSQSLPFHLEVRIVIERLSLLGSVSRLVCLHLIALSGVLVLPPSSHLCIVVILLVFAVAQCGRLECLKSFFLRRFEEFGDRKVPLRIHLGYNAVRCICNLILRWVLEVQDVINIFNAVIIYICVDVVHIYILVRLLHLLHYYLKCFFMLYRFAWLTLTSTS